MRPSLGRGQKLNAVSDEADPQLDALRLEWLRRLQAPRTHASASLPSAEWDPGRALAKVTKECGRDLLLMGFHRDGSQWLYPAEMLCLLEDSLLKVTMKPAPEDASTPAAATGTDGTGTSSAAPAPRVLSLQEAYFYVLGGATPVVDRTVYAVFAYLYRGGFILSLIHI